jgi:hypothetical protein
VIKYEGQGLHCWLKLFYFCILYLLCDVLRVYNYIVCTFSILKLCRTMEN